MADPALDLVPFRAMGLPNGKNPVYSVDMSNYPIFSMIAANSYDRWGNNIMARRVPLAISLCLGTVNLR
jgi:hypothetical protein